jgi:hypothetical protein
LFHHFAWGYPYPQPLGHLGLKVCFCIFHSTLKLLFFRSSSGIEGGHWFGLVLAA